MNSFALLLKERIAETVSRYAYAIAPNAFPGYPQTYTRNAYPPPRHELNYVAAASQIAMVYACTSKISNDLARLPLRFYEGDEDDKRIIKRKPGNITDLWRKANPRDSDFTLTRDHQLSLEVSGNGYLFLETFGQDRPTEDWELWNMPGHFVKVVVQEHRLPIAYEWLGSGSVVPIDASRVIHTPFLTPNFEPRGMSPLEAARLGYETRFLMSQWNRMYYQRGGAVSHIFTTADRDADMDAKEMKETKESLRRQHSGIENAFDPVIVQGLTIERAGLTHKEMDFLESTKMSDAEICRVYGIPPVIMGIKEGGGLSDAGATADLLLYWETCIGPRLELRDRTISETLCSRFAGVGGMASTIFCKTDTSRVLALQAAKLERSKGIVIATGRPVMSINEGRDLLEMDHSDDPEADELFKPAQIDIGRPETGTAQPDAKAAAPAKAADGRAIAAARATARKRGMAQIELFNRKFAREFKRIFTAQENRALTRLRHAFDLAGKASANGSSKRAIDADRLFGDDDMVDQEALEALFDRLVRERGEDQLAELGVEVEISLNNARTARYLQDVAVQVLTQTSATTRERLRKAFAKVADAGGGLDDYVAAVQEVFDGRRANALTIARTETAGAYNFASLNAAIESGVATAKAWITAEDELVRPQHMRAEHMGEIPIDGSWVLEGDSGPVAMQMPGDPDAPPELVCNCRCTLKFIVDEAARAAKKAGIARPTTRTPLAEWFAR